MMLSAACSLIAQFAIVQRISVSPFTLLRLAMPLLIVAFTIMALANSQVMLSIAMMILGFGMGMAGPGFMAGASLAVSPAEQGSVAGVAGSCGPLGFTLGPLLGGALYQTRPRAAVRGRRRHVSAAVRIDALDRQAGGGARRRHLMRCVRRRTDRATHCASSFDRRSVVDEHAVKTRNKSKTDPMTAALACFRDPEATGFDAAWVGMEPTFQSRKSVAKWHTHGRAARRRRRVLPRPLHARNAEAHREGHQAQIRQTPRGWTAVLHVRDASSATTISISGRCVVRAWCSIGPTPRWNRSRCALRSIRKRSNTASSRCRSSGSTTNASLRSCSTSSGTFRRSSDCRVRSRTAADSSRCRRRRF